MASEEYQQSGVDYDRLDHVKRLAVAAAAATDDVVAASRDFATIAASRGEPAFCFHVGDETLALVVEGLGTKSMVASQVMKATNENFFDLVAEDAVAAIVNDLLCVGALPVVVNAYWAVGDAGWYDSEAAESLIAGWQRACALSGAVWGGGESPALPGLVVNGEIELAGSALGVLPRDRRPLIGDAISAGDRMVIVGSSGMHTNGASMMRRLAAELPDGFGTPIDETGSTFGQAVLVPTINYVGLMRRILADPACPVSYVNHITGHGLLKLMRPEGNWRYVVETLPPVPPVLQFFADQRRLAPEDAYRLFNMGAGLVLYVPPQSVPAVIAAAAAEGLDAMDAGHIEAGPRSVELTELALTYDSDEMRLR